MVLIGEFSESAGAREVMEYLASQGIRACLAVDPLSSRAPALGAFAEVGLFVEDLYREKAQKALKAFDALSLRRAG